jgi:guanyl-specific ribonuclease Sa
MHVSHRAMNWLPILLAAWIVSAILSFAAPVHCAEQAAELVTTEHDASSSGQVEREISPPQTATERKVPAKVYELLETLQRRKGEPLPGYVGGRLFRNRERRLPPGRYKEYDVNRRVRGRPRDAERLVIEQETGQAYYTDDHYRTFLPLN